MVIVALCNLAFIIILTVVGVYVRNAYVVMDRATDPEVVRSARSALVDTAYMLHTSRMTVENPTREQSKVGRWARGVEGRKCTGE